jgi:hypothetical protein
MCLNKLDNGVKVRRKEGWQVFREINGELYPLYYNGEEEQDVEEWTDAETAEVKTISSDVPMKRLQAKYSGQPLDLEDPEVEYTAAYHIFLRKMDADLYAKNFASGVVMKVEFDDVVAKGYQNFIRKVDGQLVVAHAPCVVAIQRCILD